MLLEKIAGVLLALAGVALAVKFREVGGWVNECAGEFVTKMGSDDAYYKQMTILTSIVAIVVFGLISWWTGNWNGWPVIVIVVLFWLSPLQRKASQVNQAWRQKWEKGGYPYRGIQQILSLVVGLILIGAGYYLFTLSVNALP